MTEFDFASAWHEAFESEISEQYTKTQVDPSEWKRSGRVSKDKPNKEDLDWWIDNGVEFCRNFVPWFEEGGWQIWEPVPGQLAIEMALAGNIGGWRVQGFLDAALISRTGEMVAFDWKSGSSSPESNLQLGIYGELLYQNFGIRPAAGAYWKARDGDNLPLVPLDRYNHDYLAQIIQPVGEKIKLGLFDPRLGRHCEYFCGVNLACSAYQGSTELTRKYDPHDPFFSGNCNARPSSSPEESK